MAHGEFVQIIGLSMQTLSKTIFLFRLWMN